MAVAVITLVILCFNLCSTFVSGDIISKNYEQKDNLRLPTEYHFKGDVTSLDYGIIRPFEIWYSAQHNRSRKDTYGGTVKRYHYGDNETMYTIHPKAYSDLVSESVCSTMPTEDKVENFLPSNNFTHSGETTFNNKQVDVWRYSKFYEKNLMLEAKLLVLKYLENDIPLVYEEREFNPWNGAVESHSVTRYYDFQEPIVDDLTYEQEDNCNLDESSEMSAKLRYLHAHIPSDVEEAFKRYKNYHNKGYENDEEQELRALMFKRNWRLVTEHNNRNLSYKLSLNKFSDRLPSELTHLTATKPGDPHALGSLPFPLSAQQLKVMADDLPDSYDMRVEGIISEVKTNCMHSNHLLSSASAAIDQGDCGSCWAFSTVAAVEGALAKYNGGRILDLSEQSLVDCAWYEGNDGCDGGFLEDSFEYVRKYGIPTEMEYGTYLSEDGICNYDNVSEVSSIKGFARIPPMSDTAMKAVLYHYGPVAVSINAMDDLKYYFNGVYNNPDCNKGHINHAVTIVGYGIEDGTPYWIVKNSWGEDWGQNGYFYISAEGNNCHILEEAYYPIV